MEKKLTTVSERPDNNLKQHKREEQEPENLSMEMLIQDEIDTLDMCLTINESYFHDYDSGDADGIGGYMYNHDILTGKSGCDSLSDWTDCRFDLSEKLSEQQ